MVIDFCCAIGPWAFRRLPVVTAEECRRALKREGIGRAVVSSLPAVLYKNSHEGNVQLAEEIAAHGAIFAPFAVLNPMFPGWREDLRRCREELGMRGLKLHPNYQGWSLRRREARALVAQAAAWGWSVAVSVRLEDERFHHWRMKVRPTPARDVAALALAIPEATVVLSGGSYAEVQEFLRLVADAPNAYAEIGWVKSPLEAVRACVTEFGPERLLFGTNLPFMVPWCGSEKIRHAEIGEDAKQAILGGNAARILRGVL
jgi:uncharacterized protein